MDQAQAARSQPNPFSKPVDLLESVFAVSQAAKRCADAAWREYEKRRHGNATDCRQRKEFLYKVKDTGSAAAFLAGRITLMKVIGNLAQYQGEGYVFYSPLVPASLQLPCVDAAPGPLADSKPADVLGTKLKAAERMLEQLPPVPRA